MPRTQLTPAQLQPLHTLAAQWGIIIARRTGDDAIDFDLDALEQKQAEVLESSGRR